MLSKSEHNTRLRKVMCSYDNCCCCCCSPVDLGIVDDFLSIKSIVNLDHLHVCHDISYGTAQVQGNVRTRLKRVLTASETRLARV